MAVVTGPARGLDGVRVGRVPGRGHGHVPARLRGAEVDRRRDDVSLAGVDVERVHHFVAMACVDHRDVVMFAEYPPDPDAPPDRVDDGHGPEHQ